MALYDEMQEIARELLGDPDFKQGSTQLLKMIPGSGPVDDPGPGTPEITELDGAVRGVRFSYVARGLAVATDRELTHSVVPGVVPAMTDFVVVDGVPHKIRQIIAKPDAGTPVVYTLIFHR